MTRPMYDHINRVMRGKFPSWLATRHERGDSNDTIARELWDSYGIVVSGESIRRWTTKEVAE